jgi:hypothetical protein
MVRQIMVMKGFLGSRGNRNKSMTGLPNNTVRFPNSVVILVILQVFHENSPEEHAALAAYFAFPDRSELKVRTANESDTLPSPHFMNEAVYG